MSQRTRLILVIVAGALLCLAVYFLLVRSRQGELNTLNESIAAEASRTAQLQVELERLQDLQRRAPELQAELDRFRGLVPQNHEIADLLLMIDEAAKESGVTFADITPELPKSPPEGAALAEVRMTIGSNGGYFALQDFIRRLYDLDRALRIDNITLSGTEAETGGTTIDLQLTARVFFDLGGASGAAEGAPPNTATPAETPAPVTTPAG
jgi:Tfp pilus assembly protein PilO